MGKQQQKPNKNTTPKQKPQGKQHPNPQKPSKNIQKNKPSQQKQSQQQQNPKNNNKKIETQKKVQQQKQNPQKEKKETEQKIREYEKKLVNQNTNPENEDEFETEILKNPNSSYLWIQYIAHSMEASGIEKSREIADRALKVINFRNEKEKSNIWTAYMNLEHNFGTPDILQSVFERSQLSCKPKAMYFQLLDIYRKGQSYDELLELSTALVKKFKHSTKAWNAHFKNISEIILNAEQHSEVNDEFLKEQFKRAQQCVKQKKHVMLQSQFARLLYSMKQPEQGRTEFETIIQNNPKRTDIWGIYLDAETKFGCKQACRNLYEKVISMSFKTRKMKYFFKRYVQYEMEHGTEEKVEQVKLKAQEYVRQQMQLNKDGSDSENENMENEDEE